MRRGVMAVLAVVWWLAGCGVGGSLPEGPTGGGAPVLPGEPVEPDAGLPNEGPDPHQSETSTSLWPLTTGSQWTYRIEDPNYQGAYTKHVEVLGPAEVPQTNPARSAVLVHSRQDRVRNNRPEVYEERSWQLELTNGLVVRLREEDYIDSQSTPIRVTRWTTRDGAPAAIVKSISRVPTERWPHRDLIREVVVLGGDPNNPETKDRTYEWSSAPETQPVVVPAGTFTNAIRVTRTKINKDGIATDARTYWLVPGVGKVKEEGERTELLQSYEVKQ